MQALHSGNVIRIISTNEIAILNRIEIDKGDFNSAFISYALDLETLPKDCNRYVCFTADENGLTKKHRLTIDELKFVRNKY